MGRRGSAICMVPDANWLVIVCKQMRVLGNLPDDMTMMLTEASVCDVETEYVNR